MTKNSLPAEEILKHICKHKKSRALGHEGKGATLSESGKNAQKYMFTNCWLGSASYLTPWLLFIFLFL